MEKTIEKKQLMIQDKKQYKLIKTLLDLGGVVDLKDWTVSKTKPRTKVIPTFASIIDVKVLSKTERNEDNAHIFQFSALNPEVEKIVALTHIPLIRSYIKDFELYEKSIDEAKIKSYTVTIGKEKTTIKTSINKMRNDSSFRNYKIITGYSEVENYAFFRAVKSIYGKEAVWIISVEGGNKGFIFQKKDHGKFKQITDIVEIEVNRSK